jgi:hypothetical protein
MDQMKRVADMTIAAALGALAAGALLRPSTPFIAAQQAAPVAANQGAAPAAPQDQPAPADPNCDEDLLFGPVDDPAAAAPSKFDQQAEAIEWARFLAEERLRERLERPARTSPAAEAPPEAIELTPEFIARCIEVAHDLDPAMAKRLEDLRRTRPESFERALRLSRRLVYLTILKDRDTRLYQLKVHEFQLDAQARRLAQRAREARREGRADLAARAEDELRSLVKLQLVQSIKTRGEYLNKLRQQVSVLEIELDRDAADFEKTAERRFAELLNPTLPTVGRSIEAAPASSVSPPERRPAPPRR